MILRCLLYLLTITVVIFLIGRIYPRKWIKEDKFPFKSYKREKGGKIYEKIGIRKWKTKFPDFSTIITKILPKFMPKKRLDGKDIEKIPVLIKESCVAESTHIVALFLGFGCVIVSPNACGWIFAILYGLCNIPPILIQRYNRPRLKASVRFVKPIIKQEVFDTHIQLVPNSTQEELRAQANIEPSILREAK